VSNGHPHDRESEVFFKILLGLSILALVRLLIELSEMYPS
jgi:hypothetical protein